MKEVINIRMGDRMFNRLLDSLGFILDKSKMPKKYNGAVTKYMNIITTNQKGTFEIVNIDFNYSDKLCYIQINPLILDFILE